MEKGIPELKLRLPKEGLYIIALKRIESCKEENKDLIGFPKCFCKLCSSFQISKRQAWEMLYMFQDMGFLRIITGHGLELYYQFEENCVENGNIK
ncbi:MAG: hypothetical protein ACP5NZ_01305 [Nanobdellota archaeon]